MPTKHTNSGSIANMAEVVAALMWGPKTYAELQAYTGKAWPDPIVKAIRALRDVGAVRLADLRYPDGGGPPAHVFALQAKPFDQPDIDVRAMSVSTIKRRAMQARIAPAASSVWALAQSPHGKP